MRPRKLTDAQKAEIRTVIAAKREAQRVLDRAFPTNLALARQYGVCEQSIYLLGRADEDAPPANGVFVGSHNIVRG